ncbi:MAG TPA: class I SAM-dependent methyltransferase [Telluria sp.]|nr:class I SAM-dependent methyltransferase [Telluria sp.]
MRPGLAPWHFVCSQCAYESGGLAPAINDRDNHDLDEVQREIALKQLRSENFKLIVARARHHVHSGRNKTLLDVGSAHGWFLEQAMADFEVLGIEPDEQVGQVAAARGLPVRQGYFPQALTPGESFDVIVFNDVIEHIPDIRTALDECRKRLNAGGVLILNLPSSAGIFYRIAKFLARFKLSGPFDRLWQKSMPSPHVHYFNHRNLTALVDDAGLKAVETFDLPSVGSEGLLERIRFVGKGSSIVSYLQYLLIRCAIPFIRMFRSDIVVCVFRKT